MLSLQVQKSWRRNLWLGSALVSALVVGIGLGTVFTTNAVAQGARTFSGGTGMMLNYVDPGATADFEAVMRKLSEGLQASANPDRNRQAQGWKVYRAQEAGPNNSVLYVWFIDPTVSGADYAVSQILNEAFPEEVQALYETFNASFAGGQSLVNLDLVVDF